VLPSYNPAMRGRALFLLALTGCGASPAGRSVDAGHDADGQLPVVDGGPSDDAQLDAVDASTSAADAMLPADAMPPPDAMPTPDAMVGPFTQACTNGPGWSLFRIHMQGTFVILDHWDAACAYSLAPDSTCMAGAYGNISATPDDVAVILDGTDRLMIRYAATGLPIVGATLYVSAKAISTGSSAQLVTWSPIHGELRTDFILAGFTYPWYAVDWTDMVSPSDDPDLTAVVIQGGDGAPLGVRAVELCVR
jgi:hypothetical protein